MTELRIREDKNIYNLYMDPVVLPDKDIYKLSYGDKAYDVKNNKGYIYKGETAGWVDHTVGSSEFYGEFTMADTAGHFRIGSNTGDAQYSSDNVNWTDVTTPLEVTGSLKWYVRQKPGGTTVTEVKFSDSDFVTVDKLETKGFTSFEEMFNNCSALTSIPAINTSKGSSFGYMFKGCSALTTVPAMNTSKGAFFGNMFNGCSKLTSIPAMNTSKGTNFDNMFNGCPKLACLTLIDTTKSTSASNMFSNCSSLQHPTAAEQTQITTTPGIAWTNPNPCPPPPFYAEFTMEDTADHFKILTWGISEGAQYSSDNVNWTDVDENADVTGSLKWYVRQKPGAPFLPYISFTDSDILSCDKLEPATVTSLSFRGCQKLTSVPMFDTSAFEYFVGIFQECPSLTSVPAYDTSKELISSLCLMAVLS